MTRLALTGLLAFLVMPTLSQAADDAEAVREGLRKLGDFIGEWKGDGKPETGNPDSKSWMEKLSWGWKFKQDDAWIAFTIKDGKYFKSGEVRYRPAKKKYEVTVIDVKDKPITFVGSYQPKAKKLKLVSETGEELNIAIAGDGVFMNYDYAAKAPGRAFTSTLFRVAAKKEGESFVAGGKKPECVVSGGTATIAVSFGGKTYYVCCSGCKEEFERNPAKIVKEYEDKKKRGE